MSIKKIGLKNFKCFEEVEIDFSKITLLTGANSSGKSSLLYGLLAAFQSKDFPFYLSLNGKYVNMGDFEEVAFQHGREHLIGLNMTVNNIVIETCWGLELTHNMPKLRSLKIAEVVKNAYYLEILPDQETYVVKYKIIRNNEPISEQHSFKTIDDFLKIIDEHNKYETGDAEESLERTVWKMLTDAIKRSLDKIDKNLNFFGSFRLQPERTYYQKAKAEDRVGQSGEGYIEQIVEWDRYKSEKLEQLLSMLRSLRLLDGLQTKQLPGGRFELSVKVSDQGVWASLADVGFGVSQLLPMIVADLQLSEHSTLLLAQPEIHLHPSIQASLADYFIKQTKTHSKHYIVETHSEYLLNRIRLAIVKGELEPADAAVYYFENSLAGTVTHKIEFTKDGQIKNAPQGFFETYMMDVMDIALHA